MAEHAPAPEVEPTEAQEPPKKRPRTEGLPVPTGLVAFHHVDDWYEQHKAEFSPPVCNRVMHRGQLTIMFVGGPNTREDFHLEEGSEFFFQLRGDMEMPTVQRGKRKLVRITQGQIFCLPSRIPHSPQRPSGGSLGLVIERRREIVERDALLFYTDFQTCEKVHWEGYFKCDDLGKDLPPVIGKYREFQASGETEAFPEEERPVQQDKVTEVPPPFFLEDFLVAHGPKLEEGEAVPLLACDHPDKEFQVLVVGGTSEQRAQCSPLETWLYQLRGTAHVSVKAGTLTLTEGCCCIVTAGTSYDVSRCKGSIGLVVRADPAGNKTSEKNPAAV